MSIQKGNLSLQSHRVYTSVESTHDCRRNPRQTHNLTRNGHPSRARVRRAGKRGRAEHEGIDDDGCNMGGPGENLRDSQQEERRREGPEHTFLQQYVLVSRREAARGTGSHVFTAICFSIFWTSSFQSTEFAPDCARERRVRYRGWWNKNRIYRLRNCANLAFLYHNRSSVPITVFLYQ